MDGQTSLFNKFSKKLSDKKESLVVTDARVPDNPIIFCSPGFTDLTGYSMQDIIGRNCRFLQNDDTNQPEARFVGEAIKEGRVCRVVLRNYKKDGELFWNELTLTPIINNKGEPLYFIGVQRDVTQEVKLCEDIALVFKSVFGLGGEMVRR